MPQPWSSVCSSGSSRAGVRWVAGCESISCLKCNASFPIKPRLVGDPRGSAQSSLCSCFFIPLWKQPWSVQLLLDLNRVGECRAGWGKRKSSSFWFEFKPMVSWLCFWSTHAVHLCALSILVMRQGKKKTWWTQQSMSFYVEEDLLFLVSYLIFCIWCLSSM